MDRDSHGRANGMSWRAPLVFMGFAAIAAFLLLTEHRAHLLGILPWALVLVCPLLHVFMHHGGHGRKTSRTGSDRSSAPPPETGAHRH